MSRASTCALVLAVAGCGSAIRPIVSEAPPGARIVIALGAESGELSEVKIAAGDEPVFARAEDAVFWFVLDPGDFVGSDGAPLDLSKLRAALRSEPPASDTCGRCQGSTSVAPAQLQPGDACVLPALAPGRMAVRGEERSDAPAIAIARSEIRLELAGPCACPAGPTRIARLDALRFCPLLPDRPELSPFDVPLAPDGRVLVGAWDDSLTVIDTDGTLRGTVIPQPAGARRVLSPLGTATSAAFLVLDVLESGLGPLGGEAHLLIDGSTLSIARADLGEIALSSIGGRAARGPDLFVFGLAAGSTSSTAPGVTRCHLRDRSLSCRAEAVSGCRALIKSIAWAPGRPTLALTGAAELAVRDAASERWSCRPITPAAGDPAPIRPLAIAATSTVIALCSDDGSGAHPELYFARWDDLDRPGALHHLGAGTSARCFARHEPSRELLASGQTAFASTASGGFARLDQAFSDLIGLPLAIDRLNEAGGYELAVTGGESIYRRQVPATFQPIYRARDPVEIAPRLTATLKDGRMVSLLRASSVDLLTVGSSTHCGGWRSERIAISGGRNERIQFAVGDPGGTLVVGGLAAATQVPWSQVIDPSAGWLAIGGSDFDDHRGTQPIAAAAINPGVIVLLSDDGRLFELRGDRLRDLSTSPTSPRFSAVTGGGSGLGWAVGAGIVARLVDHGEARGVWVEAGWLETIGAGAFSEALRTGPAELRSAATSCPDELLLAVVDRVTAGGRARATAWELAPGAEVLAPLDQLPVFTVRDEPLFWLGTASARWLLSTEIHGLESTRRTPILDLQSATGGSVFLLAGHLGDLAVGY